MNFSRRAFLKSASASLGVTFLDPRLLSQTDLEKTFAEIRANLLEMVNEERAVAKVPPVAIDELATQVATKHAIDMATGEFASHWGRDGFKAYQRYSFAGGTDATQENISAADNTWSTKLTELKQDTAYLHVRLYQEKPPNDGHRQAILAPQHTHVGFGVAIEQLRLRLVELFVARYVKVGSVRRTTKPGATLYLSAKILDHNYVLDHVEVCYEPLPKAPDLNWLRQPRSYSLPRESVELRKKVPPPFIYSDGVRGVIDALPGGSFSFPVKLFKEQPGIYTVVAWIKRDGTNKTFAATEICIRAE
ncbi:MAG TPA: CAP domain-containing protein [Pyrinomonadaceae bacterium]